jgi:hypothetical protein
MGRVMPLRQRSKNDGPTLVSKQASGPGKSTGLQRFALRSPLARRSPGVISAVLRARVSRASNASFRVRLMFSDDHMLDMTKLMSVVLPYYTVDE